MLEHFHYSVQGFGQHSSATVPIGKVQELTCRIKNPFHCAHANLECWAVRLGSRGVAIFDLKKKKKRETSTKRFEEVEYLSLMPRVLRGA